jgi:hypothetical protein
MNFSESIVASCANRSEYLSLTALTQFDHLLAMLRRSRRFPNLLPALRSF